MTPQDLPPLSLYVHLPWCVRKCPYCDFNSYEAQGPPAERAYVAALLRDLDAELPFVQGRAVSSLFMGGGTPSLFSGAAIEALLGGIRARVPLVADAEITLEANPIGRPGSIGCLSACRVCAIDSSPRSDAFTMPQMRCTPSTRPAAPGSSTSTSI